MIILDPVLASELSVGPTAEGMHIGFYLEHLEECSFLYSQRINAIEYDEVFWPNVKQFVGDRLDSHFSALVLGDDLALAVCRKQSVEGDAGELFAAVSVFCRQGRRNLLDAVLEDLDWGDEERVLAVTDALCLELPESWADELIRTLLAGDSAQLIMACRVIAFRRLPFVESMVPLLSHAEECVRDAALWALAQCGTKDELAAVERPIILQALCGDAVAVKAESRDAIMALGIRGDSRSVPDLLTALADAALAESAALSLNLITGAGLKETIFIPEVIEEEDLFPDEVEKFRAGTLYPEGEWPGETVARITQDPEVWTVWWNEHQERFTEGQRYRNGAIFSKPELMDLLEAEDTSNPIRQWIGYELTLQFGCEVPFDTMMRVPDQKAAIAAMRL